MKSVRMKLLFAGSFAVFLISGLGPFGTSNLASAQELKRVTLRLALTYNAHRSAYLLGVERGYYKDEGLDVQVLEGRGTTAGMQLVANKQDTFAVVDPPSLMLGVAQGMPIKTVLLLYQKSPNSVVSWGSANISQPKDLIGKTLVTLQGDTTTTMLYALLAKNNINRKDVKIFTADSGTRTQTFLSKRADANSAFSNDSYLTLKAANPDIRYFMYADYGVNTMGDSIVANNETLKNSPDVVRGFVKATIRAYKESLADPEASVDALLKVAKTQNRALEVSKIVATRELVNSPDTAIHGFGYSSKGEWQAVETLMFEYGGLTKKAPDVEAYYTNEFLPPK